MYYYMYTIPNTMSREPLILTNYINTALTQFTQSKTANSLDYIKHYREMAILEDIPMDGMHNLFIILANNSLLESSQWLFRTNSKLSDIMPNVWTLSSKKNDTNHSHVDSIISSFTKSENKSDLINVIICPTNKTRIDDVITIIETLQCNTINLSSFGINQFNVQVMFDEADKSILLICDFIKRLLNLLKDKVNYTISSIHYITATPYDEFWKKLEKVGVRSLKNLKHCFNDINHDRISFADAYEQYRKIEDHTHIAEDNESENPVIYANIAYKKHIANSGNIGLTIYAPSETTKKSHDDMASTFLVHGFTIIILNGDKKVIQSSDRTIKDIDEYKKENKIDGELKDVLRKWRCDNPSTNVVITGNILLERGITFNTTGFNFTHMILSMYHVSNIKSLIQMLGRATGNSKYVNKFTIIAPTKLMNIAKERINIFIDAIKCEPVEFSKSSFTKKSKRDLLQDALTIPSIVKVEDDKWEELTKKSRREYNNTAILAYIKDNDVNVWNDIQGKECFQITMPTSENSYKKHIEDAITAYNKQSKFAIDIKKEHKEKRADIYQILFDYKNKQLIVSIYNASKLPSLPGESESSE